METRKSAPSPPPPQAVAEEENQELITSHKHANAHKPKTSFALYNFKKLVKDIAFASAQTNTLTSILEHHLDHLFPRLHTPDHPPYAAMILEAIEQLNEEEGSSKELISTFIKENYKDLPWAHDGMLEHHLYLLCKNSYLTQTEDGHYLVANGASERSDGPNPSPASTPLTSDSVGSSYNSVSSSSSSSGSDYRSEVLGKRKLLPNKQKKEQRRKRIRKSGKSVNEICAGRTKSSIIRLGKSSKEDGFLISSEVEAATKHGLMLEEEEEKEFNEVASEAYGSTQQPWGATTDTDSEFYEQENQKKKRKKTVKMQTQVARRGRPPKKKVLEIRDGENYLMTEDKPGVSKQEPKSLNEQTMNIAKLNEVTGGKSKITEQEKNEKSNGEGDNSPPHDEHNSEVIKQLRIVSGDRSPDEIFEKQNSRVDHVNEVLGEQTKLLQLLQDPATGEYLPGREDDDDDEEEAYKQIEVLVGHTEATTKKQGSSSMRMFKQGVNSNGITPLQTPIAGKVSLSGKKRGRPRKQLVFEETKPIPEEMGSNYETSGKAHQFQEAEDSDLRDVPVEVQIAMLEQNLQDEVPKKRRGRPPKNDASKKQRTLQDPNGEGQEAKITPVPGRKRGRPRKRDLSTQVEMVEDKFQRIMLQDISGKTVED